MEPSLFLRTEWVLMRAFFLSEWLIISLFKERRFPWSFSVPQGGKIEAIEEKCEKLQEHFRSRVRAVGAAGLTLCQAQYMPRRRKEALSPLAAYRFEITCCSSLLCTLPRQGSPSNLQPTDNTNEVRVTLRTQVLLLALYLSIQSKGKILAKFLEGRRLVSLLIAPCLLPIFLTFWLMSMILSAYISCRIHQRETQRFMTAPSVRKVAVEPTSL